LISDKIQAITFDAVGTLIVPYPSVGAIYAQTMAKFGLDIKPATIEKRFGLALKSTTKDRSITNSEDREYEYWRSIVGTVIEASEKPSDLDFDTLFVALWDLFATAKPWKPVPRALEILGRLSKTYPLAIVTNWDSRARSALRELELLQFFDKCIISSEVGYDKPDKRIFQRTAAELGLATNAILHIGDSLREDIEGALTAGCEAIWITQNSASPPSGARRIREFSELNH